METGKHRSWRDESGNRCPLCNSEADVRVIITWMNLLRGTLSVTLFLLAIGLAVVGLAELFDPYVPLRRRCVRCGLRFCGQRIDGRPLNECARCGYCLTGNHSGVCPECGWRLPREYRRHLRQAIVSK